MFNKKEATDTIIKQGEKIIELEEENLELIGQLTDAQENTLYILDYLQYILERNNYKNEEIQRRTAVECIENIRKNIGEKGLENIIELLNFDWQSC